MFPRSPEYVEKSKKFKTTYFLKCFGKLEKDYLRFK